MAAAPPSGPVVTFEPPPNETAYYEGLFAAADQAKTGQLNGREAVGFLSRSKLPLDLLKNIWTMADSNPKTNYLDKKKFFIAVRLIQIFQNGQSPADAALSSPEGVTMRPPFFEGITDANVPSSPAPTEAESVQQPAPPAPVQTQQQQQQQSAPPAPVPAQQPMANAMTGQTIPTTLAAQDPYSMQPGEQSRYENLFPQYAKEDDFVYGKEAVELFSKSGMEKTMLRDIWNMVDNPVDNRLSKLEFAIAMHLIVCVTKKNLPMPPGLPPSLKTLKDAENNAGVMPPPAGIPDQRPSTAATIPVQNGIGAPPPGQPEPPLQQSVSGEADRGMAITDAFSEIGPPEITPPTPAAPAPDSVENQQSYVPQLNTYNQPPPVAAPELTYQNPAPPAEIAIDEANKQTPSIISAIQPSPTHQARRPTIEPPKMDLPPGVTSVTGVGNDVAELEQVRSVLQKLQAENVSLKAQLGQYSEEERSVRQEITSTVSEIGVLSQELTTLRSKVVEAKSSLIEATSELKAQIEKRDNLREIVEESRGMVETMETGSNHIKDLSNNTAIVKVSQPENASYGNFFAYNPPAPLSDHQSQQGASSVNNDGYVDVSASYYGVEAPAARSVQQPAQAPEELMGGAPSITSGQNSLESPSMPYDYVPPTSERSVRANDQLEELKKEAARSKREAAVADDQARALAIQVQELRAELEKGDAVVKQKQTELQTKKKAFLRGSTKPLKREIEGLLQESLEKRRLTQEAQASYTSSQSEATRLQRHAEAIQQEAEDLEQALAQTAAAPPAPMPVPTPSQTNYQPQMGYGGFPGETHPEAPVDFGAFGGTAAPSYAPPSVPPPTMPPTTEPTPMGFGGYAPPSIGEMGNTTYTQMPAAESLMGGSSLHSAYSQEANAGHGHNLGVSVQATSEHVVEVVGQSNDTASVVSQNTQSVKGINTATSYGGTSNVSIRPDSESGVEVVEKKEASRTQASKTESETLNQSDHARDTVTTAEGTSDHVNNLNGGMSALDIGNNSNNLGTEHQADGNLDQSGRTGYTGIMGYGPTSQMSVASATNTADNSIQDTSIHSTVNSLYGQGGYVSDTQSRRSQTTDTSYTSRPLPESSMPAPASLPQNNSKDKELDNGGGFAGIPTPTNSNIDGSAYPLNNNVEGMLGGISSPHSNGTGADLGALDLNAGSAEATFGQIPALVAGDGTTGVGGGEAFGEISAPISTDTGVSTVNFGAPTASNDTGASMGGANFGEINTLASNDTGVSMAASNFGGISAPASYDNAPATGGTAFTGSDIGTGMGGSNFGGIPDPTSNDTMNSTIESNFGGIPSPASNDIGDIKAENSFAGIPTPTASDIGTGMEGGNFGGIPAPTSHDTGKSMTETAFGGISAPTSGDPSIGGGIPAPTSDDNVTNLGETNFGSIPTPLSGDAGSLLGGSSEGIPDAGTGMGTTTFGGINLGGMNQPALETSTMQQANQSKSMEDMNTMSNGFSSMGAMGGAELSASNDSGLDGIPSPTGSFTNNHEYENPFAGM